MPPMPLNFGLRSNPGRHGHDGAIRLVNCYAERREAEGKALWGLYASEGLTSWATLTYGGPVQGMLDVDGTLVVAAARNIYTVTALGEVTHVGGFPIDGHVTIARNRKSPDVQTALCAGGRIIKLQAGALTDITSLLPIAGPIAVTVINGRAVVVNEAGQIAHSAIDDMDTWNGLALATASSSPDGARRVFRRGAEAIVFGARSTEYWSDVGSTPFAFAQVQGTANDLGCLSGASVADVTIREGETAIFWVAHDGTVRRATGYTGVAVSTDEVERLIRDEPDKSAIQATTYTVPGHAFYVLSGATWTRVYDASLGLWHDRESYQIGRWRGALATGLDNRTIVGDYETGALYEMSETAHDEAGEHLLWSARALLHAYPAKLRVNELRFDVIPGVGLNTTDTHEQDPQLIVRGSRDGGKSWLPPRIGPMGKIGEHSWRLPPMRRWGMTREDGLLVEISASAAVVRGLTGASADVERLAT